MRKWFTEENTQLPSVDLTILNRAARYLRDKQAEELTRLQLMGLRTLYRPGMNTNDLLEKYELEVEIEWSDGQVKEL